MKNDKSKKQLTEQERKTIRFYNEQGRNWVQKREPNKESLWATEIEELHRLLPAGKLLEIGVGGGKEARLLIKKGYDYVGVDASIGILEVAKQYLPANTALYVASLHELPFEDNLFDGFWTAATLLHIPKDRINDALQSIKRVIKTGGVGFISLREGVGEGLDDAGTGRWFALYQEEEFTKILNNNGFDVLACAKRIQPSCTVKGRGWIMFFVRVVKNKFLGEKNHD